MNPRVRDYVGAVAAGVVQQGTGPGGELPVGTFVKWGPRRDSGGWVVAENGCHIWTGDKSPGGYARAGFNRKKVYIHRFRYEREIGPIPEGMELDHYVCDNGAGGCCNPHHCRPVTHRENVLRSRSQSSALAARTHCPRGHLLAGDNLLPYQLRTRGKRECKLCSYELARLRRRARTS